MRAAAKHFCRQLCELWFRTATEDNINKMIDHISYSSRQNHAKKIDRARYKNKMGILDLNKKEGD